MAGIDLSAPTVRGRLFDLGPIALTPSAVAPGRAEARRRNVGRARRGSGRQVAAEPMPVGEAPSDLATAATLAAAAARRLEPWRATAGWSVQPEDWRRKVRRRRRGSLVVFVVDASESMGVQARMTAAKGAVLGLLRRAHQQRDRVALVVFEGEGAHLLLPPTRSVERARRQLQAVPIGGATPLADGLRVGWQVVRAEWIKDPTMRPLLVVVSDGAANVPMNAARSVEGEVRRLATSIRRDGLGSIVIDARPPGAVDDFMVRLAAWLGASYHHVDQLRATRLVEAVRVAPR